MDYPTRDEQMDPCMHTTNTLEQNVSVEAPNMCKSMQKNTSNNSSGLLINNNPTNTNNKSNNSLVTNTTTNQIVNDKTPPLKLEKEPREHDLQMSNQNKSMRQMANTLEHEREAITSDDLDKNITSSLPIGMQVESSIITQITYPFTTNGEANTTPPNTINNQLLI